MPMIELSAGTIDYEDRGSGPVLVLIHGLLMDGSLWRHVVGDLGADHRCVVPTFPLGSHRQPMRPDADLTLHGQARLLAEFIERLELTDVTLIANDWGMPQVVVADQLSDRIGRLVLTSCEAFDNYPPGLPGRFAGLSAKLPGGTMMAVQSLRLRPLRRLPMTLGWMSKRLPDDVIDAWLRPALADRRVRRDLRKYASAVPDRETLLGISDRLRAFAGPVLVAWAAEDRVMPPEHGRRLAGLFAQARLVEIDDSYTLIPEDQPVILAREVRAFVAETSSGRSV